jgi:hypothetical protein
MPQVGEYVYCVEGPAEVVKLLGKTGDGSRLLELRFPGRREPFFAAASNVLLAERGDPAIGDTRAAESEMGKP